MKKKTEFHSKAKPNSKAKQSKKPKRIAKPKIDPKLWDCGEWLETFLNEELDSNQFRELALKAIRILDIQFELNEDEPSLAHIARMESLANPEIHLFDQWGDINGEIPIKDWHEVYGDILLNDGKKFGFKETNEFQTEAVSISLGPVTVTREAILDVFKRLLDTKGPWDKALAELLSDQDKYWSNETIEMNLIGGSTEMLSGYANVNGKLKRVNLFNQVGNDPRQVFQWNTTLSRIFFTFMELGGKDYFGFCDYCGKFMLVQRHRRKKFCSTNCRVYNHNKPTIPRYMK